jgi:hypothetical protein
MSRVALVKRRKSPQNMAKHGANFTFEQFSHTESEPASPINHIYQALACGEKYGRPAFNPNADRGSQKAHSYTHAARITTGCRNNLA